MKRKSAREIGTAVEGCIIRYHHAAGPSASLLEALDMLRQIGWRLDDVLRVERIVRMALGDTRRNWPEENAA